MKPNPSALIFLFCFALPFMLSLFINTANALVPTPQNTIPVIQLSDPHETITSQPNHTPSQSLPTKTPLPAITSTPTIAPTPSPTHTPPLLADEQRTVKVYDRNENAVISMNLHDYLISVVAGEMPATFELEALKAQAVAARTFTVKHMAGTCGSNSQANVCTYYGCCQAYKTPEAMKSGWGNDYEVKYSKIKAAVEETDGMIMTHDGRPITVFFFSTSNGYTEACQDVFVQNLPYYQSVSSPGEEYAPTYKSFVKLSINEFVSVVEKEFNIRLNALEIEHSLEYERSQGGRVKYLSINGTKIKGTKIRTAFGLKSTDFTITLHDGYVQFDVRGNGHGVGMSQVGANVMARNGNGFEKILRHYYVGVEILKQ